MGGVMETVDLHRSGWWRYLKERVHLEDLAIRRRIVIKWNCKKWNGEA